MLIVNLDIQNRLIKVQTENINHIEFAQRSVRKVYVTLSKQKKLLCSY